MIICVVGESGSGKSYLVDKACEFFGATQVKSYTTRPPRKNDDSHIFVSSEEFDKIRDDIVAYTMFDGNEYGATKEQCDNNLFYVVDFNGVKMLKEQYDGDIHTIYVDCPYAHRIINMENRGDRFDTITQRVKNDKEMFDFDNNPELFELIDSFFVNKTDDKSMRNFLVTISNLIE